MYLTCKHRNTLSNCRFSTFDAEYMNYYYEITYYIEMLNECKHYLFTLQQKSNFPRHLLCHYMYHIIASEAATFHL